MRLRLIPWPLLTTVAVMEQADMEQAAMEQVAVDAAQRTAS